MNKNLIKSGIIVPFCCFFIILAMSSCSNEGEIYTPAFETNQNSTKNASYQAFLASVDSLNTQYSSDKQTRGTFIGGAGVSAADCLGHFAGGYIGRWAGGALGSLTGNPIGTIAGIYIGKRVGQCVTGAICSGLANMWLSCNPNTNAHDHLTLYSNFAFSDLLDSQTDSIGYLHNVCMIRLLEKKNQFGYGTAINKSALYDEVVEFYKTRGIYEEIFEDSMFKKCLISDISDFCDDVLSYELGNISYSELVDSFTIFLQTKCNCSSIEISKFRDFGCEVNLICSTLTKDQIDSYATELYQTINNSELTLADKKDLASFAQFIINSSLCWIE
ncbi:MAG: hypothetical protein ACI4AK_06620 [Lepagella sp.]